jgi:hypothetical protein
MSRPSVVLRYLPGCPWLLVAYDVDTESQKGAERLGQLSPRRHRLRLPVGRDVIAFWHAAGLVRDWVRFELARPRGNHQILGRQPPHLHTCLRQLLIRSPWPLARSWPREGASGGNPRFVANCGTASA